MGSKQKFIKKHSFLY